MAPRHFLNNLIIPTPCSADWNSMVGNDQVRFCEHCSLHVHNLSALTRNQAERLVAQANGKLCVRYIRDPAGRPALLPVAQKLHRIGRRVSQLAAGAFTASLSVSSALAQERFAPSGAGRLAVAEAGASWSARSSITGTVIGPGGAVISGATIHASSENLQVDLYVSSGPAGEFRIENLQTGVYQLRIEAPGFAALEGGQFYLQPDFELRLDRQLAVDEIPDQPVTQETITLGGAIAFVAPEDPFINAAQDDDLETFTALIAGRDVNLRDKRSQTTALEHAVRNANREMVQLLLAAGAKVNAANEGGEVVLMMLSNEATSDLVWDLINAGADVNLKDSNDNTALIRVSGIDNLDAVKALIDAGAKVNIQNKQGRTALMEAASSGLVNIVRALVLAGADINAKDEDGMTALSLAVDNNHPAVVRFLRSKGAAERVKEVGGPEPGEGAGTGAN
jgi:hypothetical protein